MLKEIDSSELNAESPKQVFLVLSKININRCPNQQECSSSMKNERRNNSSSCEGQKWPKGSMNSLNKASLQPKFVYEIGLPSWIKKEINTSTFDNSLVSITSYILFSYKYPATTFMT